MYFLVFAAIPEGYSLDAAPGLAYTYTYIPVVDLSHSACWCYDTALNGVGNPVLT